MIRIERRDRDDVDARIGEKLACIFDDAQMGNLRPRHRKLVRRNIAEGDDLALRMTLVTGDVLLADAQSENRRLEFSAPPPTARISSNVYSACGRSMRERIVSTRRKSSSVSTTQCNCE